MGKDQHYGGSPPRSTFRLERMNAVPFTLGVGLMFSFPMHLVSKYIALIPDEPHQQVLDH